MLLLHTFENSLTRQTASLNKLMFNNLNPNNIQGGTIEIIFQINIAQKQLKMRIYCEDCLFCSRILLASMLNNLIKIHPNLS